MNEIKAEGIIVEHLKKFGSEYHRLTGREYDSTQIEDNYLLEGHSEESEECLREKLGVPSSRSKKRDSALSAADSLGNTVRSAHEYPIDLF